MNHTSISPGIHSFFNSNHFSPEEKIIINRLSKEWFLTVSGTILMGVASNYRYFLMKPTESFQELFNIEREIVVVFSDYTNFEPRTLDAFDMVISKMQELRVEKVCSMLVSRDPNIETKLRQLLKSDPEYQVIVPFNYEELQKPLDTYFIRNRFKEHFYSRDLFAFQSPLKRDTYFFGRSDLIHKIINRHRSNENSGLFGLRKTGKTSIIFGIQRTIKNSDGVTVFLDCQNPSFHGKRWNGALRLVVDEIKRQNSIQANLRDEDKYKEDEASLSFERDLLRLHSRLNKRSILIIFDEIEHISPGISLSEHWKTGNDFTLFWQTLRSLFQKHNGIFSYLIVGTNPKCVESPFINGIDNPIFNQVPYEYIPPFDVPQTREMIRKIGRIMGLHFDELLYGKLTEDFGGHPFLMRNVCSVINRLAPDVRPVRVDKSLYEKGKDLFNSEYSTYYEMIISVLKEHYKDEYEMLKFLALGDIETFNEFAQHSKEYTNHLTGYNILDKSAHSFFFKIESLKDYLVSNNKYKKIKLSLNEKYSEISERRNNIEPKIRQIIRTTLLTNLGENDAKQNVLDCMGEPRKTKYFSFTLKDIFNPNKSEIYFEDLKKIIAKNWIMFERVFGRDKEGFNTYMNAINKYRVDTHAKDISDDELSYFRVCAAKLENYIEAFL